VVEASHVPTGIDPNRPSPARVYDCFLGGTHNFAADRAVATRAVQLIPQIPEIMKANRAFLRRVVHTVLADGVRQFLDLGAGIPTEGNVHEIAREVRPDARVAYVDVDQSAVVHARAILGDDPATAVIQADLHHAETILDHPDLRKVINLDEPVCMLMIAVLHFLPDTAQLRHALNTYRERLAHGSYLAITHATNSPTVTTVGTFADLYTRTGTPFMTRDHDQFAALFDGWALLPPGVVYGPQWRPAPDDQIPADPSSYLTLAAVARK
jgi:hypothetical protein